MLGGLALGFAASATAPHALVSVFLGIASRRRLGGVRALFCSYGHSVLRIVAQLARLGPGRFGLRLACQLRAERFAHCRAAASALPPGASLGGVAPPRDAILLVRAKRMQKRAKGRSPLWHPPFWGGVDGLRCLYRFSQAPSTPARESLREKLVGPTRSTRAAVPPYGGIPSGNARTHSAVPRLP